jgi:hypothetical protein
MCGLRQARAQRMAGKFLCPLALRKIAAHAGRKRRRFDQSRHMAIDQPIGDRTAAIDHAAKDRTVRDARELQPV